METLMLGSIGPNVKLVQSLLNRIGYDPGAIDGVFGIKTQEAVVDFQSKIGFFPDGIVGLATWDVFEKLLLGYDTYTVRLGDTLESIARMNNISVDAILTSSPGISNNTLTVGEQIVVPYGIDIVFTDIDYTYEIVERQITGLKVRYPFIEVGIIGNSVMGKNLYSIKLGNGPNEVSYNGSHHANEWITTTLLMKFIENFCKAYSSGESIRGYNISDIWNQSSIYIIPMVNPDGVDLVNYWPNYTNIIYEQAAQLNKTNLPLPSVWKANIRGIDLNLNYPASWEKEHELEIEEGIIEPAPRDYGGSEPLSEPESIAMVDFTRNHTFRLIIAYHTQGQVIYYQFEDLTPPESFKIAQAFSKVSGYIISENPGEASYAGYKDWFIQEYGKPGFTTEAGIGINPIPMSQFSQIYKENEEILILGAII